jgi:hypothetical protein
MIKIMDFDTIVFWVFSKSITGDTIFPSSTYVLMYLCTYVLMYLCIFLGNPYHYLHTYLNTELSNQITIQNPDFDLI